MSTKVVPTLPIRNSLKFSFEFYDIRSPKYCLSRWQPEQIRLTLRRLKEISSKSFDELRADRRVHHFQEVDWCQTTEKEGFPETAARQLAPFHFALLGVNKQLARIYGAYSGGTFYIIWFDLNHDIWPTGKKFT